MTTRTSPISRSGPQPVVAEEASAKPAFDVVHRGYDPTQVDSWVKRVLADLKRMEHDGLSAAQAVIRQASSSPEAKQTLLDLMGLVYDEVTHQQAAAQAEMAQFEADARAAAAEIRAGAQQEAGQLVQGAKDQATVIAQQARDQAKAMLDNAAAQAAAVHEGAERRLSAVTQLHQETLSRVGQINSVTTELISSEKARGSIADEVSRLLAQPQR
jgi:cell division septum initiation protein DivIVA